MISNQNYYEILGLSTSSTIGEIQTAYKKAARKYHPDKAYQNDLTTEEATAAFKLIGEAYITLSEHEKRRIYDRGNADVSCNEGCLFPLNIFSLIGLLRC